MRAPFRRIPIAPPIYVIDRQATDWNQRNPIGTPVVVRNNRGQERRTETLSTAWMLNPYQAVVMLKGLAGFFCIDQVRPTT